MRQVSDCQWGTVGSGLAVIEAVIPVIRSVESSFEVSLLLSWSGFGRQLLWVGTMLFSSVLMGSFCSIVIRALDLRSCGVGHVTFRSVPSTMSVYSCRFIANLSAFRCTSSTLSVFFSFYEPG